MFGKYAFKKANDSIVKSNCVVTDKGVEIDWYMPKMLKLKTVYEATDKGLKISMTCMNALFGLPRYGFEMKLAASDNVEFYARGTARETIATARPPRLSASIPAPSRTSSTTISSRRKTATTATRAGSPSAVRDGVRFSAVDKPFEFSCHNYSREALERATHLHELAHNSDGVYVFIDGAQRGCRRRRARPSLCEEAV